MKKIESFQIDHDKHPIGFHNSIQANNIYTYDLRFKLSNQGDYLANSAMHTIEHLFATVIRNSDKADKVVYFGPMGCRTGFYLLLLGIEYDEAKELCITAIEKCLELKEIPGTDKQDCGNYLEHSLSLAHKELRSYLKAIK